MRPDPYVFDNSSALAKIRFDALSDLFDSGTIRHLESVGVAPGWHCLEIGAGAGAIASWLCERTGPSGSVTATDIDTRHLAHLRFPQLQVLRHDIESEELPEAAFDLVYSRLVLLHLPERERALDRMVRALKPGGWIVLEDFDSLSLLPDPSMSAHETKLQTGVALRSVMALRGIDLRFGRKLFGLLRQRGLASVCSEFSGFACQGRSPGATLLKASYEQLKDQILASGIVSIEEFAEDLARLGDSEFMTLSPVLWTAWGRAQ